MEMNWEAIAAAAELLGALGVIASLLYLADQVRTSSRIARQDAARSVLAKLNAVVDSITRDEALADLWARGSQGLSPLSTAERVRLSTFLLQIFRVYEELLSYDEMGIDWDWEGFHTQIAEVARMPGVAEWWELRRHWFSQRFRDEVASMQRARGPSASLLEPAGDNSPPGAT
jgi:hypothetical protein